MGGAYRNSRKYPRFVYNYSKTESFQKLKVLTIKYAELARALLEHLDNDKKTFIQRISATIESTRPMDDIFF